MKPSVTPWYTFSGTQKISAAVWKLHRGWCYCQKATVLKVCKIKKPVAFWQLAHSVKIQIYGPWIYLYTWISKKHNRQLRARAKEIHSADVTRSSPCKDSSPVQMHPHLHIRAWRNADQLNAPNACQRTTNPSSVPVTSAAAKAWKVINLWGHFYCFLTGLSPPAHKTPGKKRKEKAVQGGEEAEEEGGGWWLTPPPPSCP